MGNNRVVEQALEMDASKLAQVYGSKAKEALGYARDVAREDAAIAEEILTEDLMPQQQQQQHSSALEQPHVHSFHGKASLASSDPFISSGLTAAAIL